MSCFEVLALKIQILSLRGYYLFIYVGDIQTMDLDINANYYMTQATSEAR